MQPIKACHAFNLKAPLLLCRMRLSHLCPAAADLAAKVERLQTERRQLLQHLQDANEQILDLHDELGPALLRGASSPGRASRLSSVKAAAAAADAQENASVAAAADLGRGRGAHGEEMRDINKQKHALKRWLSKSTASLPPARTRMLPSLLYHGCTHCQPASNGYTICQCVHKLPPCKQPVDTTLMYGFSCKQRRLSNHDNLAYRA